MKTSKLDLIQSISEQQQKTEQLQVSLEQLSEMLTNLEKITKKSERPIIESTMLLKEIHKTTIALQSTMKATLIEVGNLSPQALQQMTSNYKAQIEALQTQLSNIDILNIETVTTNINSFSISIQTLQLEINKQLQSISIDQSSLQAHIQTQVQQAITNQAPQIEAEIQARITAKLNAQRMIHMFWAMMIFATLILLIVLYLGFQANINRKTIEAQQEIIQYNAQTITNQVNDLKNLRR